MSNVEHDSAWPELDDPDFPEAYEVVQLGTTTASNREPLPFIFNDGRRAEAGFKGQARDCVARSIAIATNLPYAEVYAALAKGNKQQRASSRTPKRTQSANHGVNTQRKWFRSYMGSLGFTWVPTLSVGHQQRTYLCQGSLPRGTLIVALRKHYVTVIDGVIHDTHNCGAGGQRCVYGYWQKK